MESTAVVVAQIRQPAARISPSSLSFPLSTLVLSIVSTGEIFHQLPEAGKSFRNTQRSENSCKLAIKSGKRYLI